MNAPLLFAATIETNINTIIDNARFPQRHGHEVLAGNVIEQAHVVLAAIELLGQETIDARTT
ncbi:hypothetical protein LVW35_10720 [Pseudomonas sp. HN11]|uniref:hypothetical protein n=1 Tax=Pseudomonas sp. HN11 TaxID=1344094 RepID=UPI001F2A9B37|nr:hypothetical protein [Pseudomonas sp. HN11]UII73607.1 hypothetical protein LVW35_10720 [Pseudomonas sp. HN11]